MQREHIHVIQHNNNYYDTVVDTTLNEHTGHSSLFRKKFTDHAYPLQPNEESMCTCVNETVL